MSDQREESAWMPSEEAMEEILSIAGGYNGALTHTLLTALIRRAAAKRALEILLNFQQTSPQAQRERLTNASYHHLCSHVDVHVAHLRKEITAAEIAAEETR